MDDFATVEQDGYSVSSNTESEEQIRENFASEPAAPADAPAETSSTSDTDAEPETAEEQAARERDEKGRFAAKAEQAEKPRSSPKARIDQVVARQREAERRAEVAEARARDLEARMAPQGAPQPTAPQAATSDAEPVEDDFANYRDYVKAQARWEARQEFTQQFQQQQAVQREQAAQQQVLQERDQVIGGYVSQVDTTLQADPTFLGRIAPEVLAIPTFNTLRPGQAPAPIHFLGEELLRSPKVTQLMQHLSDHPDDLQRLATLPPREITRAMAFLEARVGGAALTGTARPARNLSQAKPPVRPVAGSPSLSHDEPPGDEADYDAHRAFYNARDRRPVARR